MPRRSAALDTTAMMARPHMASMKSSGGPKLTENFAMIGANRIRQTTLNIPPTKEEVIEHYVGTPMHEYFEGVYSGGFKAIHKPQYVDKIPKVVKGKTGALLNKLDERGVLDKIVDDLELGHLLDRDLDVLSGGELQRVAIATAIIRGFI